LKIDEKKAQNNDDKNDEMDKKLQEKTDLDFDDIVKKTEEQVKEFEGNSDFENVEPESDNKDDQKAKI
jgi:hypothetical protein